RRRTRGCCARCLPPRRARCAPTRARPRPPSRARWPRRRAPPPLPRPASRPSSLAFLPLPEVLLEALARAVQRDGHADTRDAEHARDLAVAVALDVAQHEHLG